jgi:hypothetical protein
MILPISHHDSHHGRSGSAALRATIGRIGGRTGAAAITKNITQGASDGGEPAA